MFRPEARVEAGAAEGGGRRGAGAAAGTLRPLAIVFRRALKSARTIASKPAGTSGSLAGRKKLHRTTADVTFGGG